MKRESKKQARAAKEEAEQSTIRQRQAIKDTIEAAKEEGFPDDVEEYVLSAPDTCGSIPERAMVHGILSLSLCQICRYLLIC